MKIVELNADWCYKEKLLKQILRENFDTLITYLNQSKTPNQTLIKGLLKMKKLKIAEIPESQTIPFFSNLYKGEGPTMVFENCTFTPTITALDVQNAIKNFQNTMLSVQTD